MKERKKKNRKDISGKTISRLINNTPSNALWIWHRASAAQENLASGDHQKIHDKHKNSLSAMLRRVSTTARRLRLLERSLECQLLLAKYHILLVRANVIGSGRTTHDIPNGWAVPLISAGWGRGKWARLSKTYLWRFYIKNQVMFVLKRSHYTD